MSDEERDVERLLRQAFDARARQGVPDARVPPPLLPEQPVAGRHGGRGRWLAPLAAAALVVVVVGAALGLSGRSRSGDGHGAVGPAASTAAGPTGSAPASPVASRSASGAPVRVSLKFGDGVQVGVGMPIIAFLSRPITDAKAFEAATSVTVNGRQVHGGWYFERRYGDPGHPVEADYRLPSYWPAHAHIHLALPVRGLAAGPGLVFADSLTLDFATGAAHVVTVDNTTHRMTVLSDGKVWGDFPVSLGSSATPTRRGTKVIMEKGRSICMSGPGYHECGVKYTQRLTYDGEYLHSAPWNRYNIMHGINSSNGCTNLLPADAQKLYALLQVGDVVRYPNADGPPMQMGDGYGDWNVPWSQWRTGGLYPVS